MINIRAGFYDLVLFSNFIDKSGRVFIVYDIVTFMTDARKIVTQYKSIVQCAIFAILCAILYWVLFLKFTEYILIGRFSMYLIMTHYVLTLIFIPLFIFIIGWRLYKLAKVLDESKIIKINIVFIMLGYLASCAFPPLLLGYLGLFWVLANKYLKQDMSWFVLGVLKTAIRKKQVKTRRAHIEFTIFKELKLEIIF